MTDDNNKTCFVIAPIGEPDSDIREWSDQIFDFFIEPAARQCGYEALRADKISEPGIITSQVIQHVIDDPMVVADLTSWNPNVFYELAIRHAIRKPFIQIIRKGQRIPFDLASLRTVEIELGNLFRVQEAQEQIKQQMLQAAQAEVQSPISIALDVEVLRKSGSPEQRQLVDMAASIRELKSGLTNVEAKINQLTNSVLIPRYAPPWDWQLSSSPTFGKPESVTAGLITLGSGSDLKDTGIGIAVIPDAELDKKESKA